MYFALLDVERTDEALSPVMREGSDVYATDVCRLIEAAQRDGLVPDGEAMFFAVGVLGAVISTFEGPVRRAISATHTASAGSRCRSTISPNWWASGSCKH